MALLSFKVQADYEKVVRLREEIAKLEAQMRSFGRNTPLNEIKTVEARLAQATQQFTAITTEAAKAGATMDSSFKSQIRSASSVVNDLTSKIIDQKSVVKDVELDVKKLGEAYQKALSRNSKNAPSIKADYDAAKKALEEEKAALFGLTQEKAKASLETKKLKEEYAAFKEEAGKAVKANDGFTLSLGKIAGLIGGVTVLKQLASQVVAVRGQFQDMETSIETLVGKDMAGKLMPQIKEMAKISPLTMTDIVGAEKMMLGFNIEAEKTIDYLKAISDISMGNSQKFNSLTLAFSQMSAAGRLLGQDLNQFINAGFNPLQIIAEKTGKSIAQLKEEMSKGAVSAEMVQQAFLDATAAGGKFYNMSENASKTINGQISMMQDAMDAMFNEIGTKTEGIIIKSIQTATSLIQNYEKIGKVLAGLVATYGVYRTAVLLSTAATSKHTIAEIALTNVRIAARKAQQALNASMLTNPYVALATVVAGLVATYVALKDNTTAAEKAQKNYDDRKEEATKKEKAHADAIQALIDKVRDETQAESERVLALMALKNEYPNIFAQYDIEKLKLADILALLKQINEENQKRAVESKKQTISELGREISILQGKTNFGAGGTAGDRERLAILQEEIEKERRDLLAEDYAQFFASLAKYDDKQLDSVIARLTDISKGKGGFKAEISGMIVNSENNADYLTKYLQAAQDEKTKRTTVVPTYSEDYEKAKEEWELAKKELAKIEKDKDKFTTKQYEDAKARKETAEKAFKKLGGDPNEIKNENEKAGQQERLDSMTEKNARENARAAKDMEFKVWQSRIDAMKDGYAKTMAQKALDHQKELDSLERQKQDYIEKIVAQEKAIFDAQEDQKAKNDKKYKKQTFDADAARIRITSTDNVVKQYAKLGEDAAVAYNKAVEEAFKDWNFQDRQAVIDSMSDGDAKQRAQRLLDNEKELYNLEQQREAYIEAAKAAHILAEKKKMAADPTYMMKMFDEAQANADYDVIIDNTKKQQYDVLADEYMSYIDKKASIDASYEADKKELEDAYAKTGDDKYKRSLDERRKAYVKSLNSLEGEYNTADYRLIFGDPSKMTGATIERALEAARKKMAQLDKEADPETFQALSEAINGLEDARDNNPFEGWGTSLMGVIQTMYQIRNIEEDVETYKKQGNKEAQDAAEAQLEKSKKDLKKALVGTGIATFGDTLTKAAASMREVADASGDIDLMQQAEALEKAGGFISSVASGAASGGWIGAIIGGASSLMNMLISSITESKVVAAEAKKAYEDYLDEIARSKRQINDEDYETIFGVRALEKVIDATRLAKDAWDDYQAALEEGGTTYSYNGEKRWQTDLESMLVQLGKTRLNKSNFNSWKTVEEMFPQLFDKEKDFLTEAKAILDTYSQYSSEEWYENLLDAYNALSDYEKNIKVVDDYLTSLFSNVGSEIADAIMQGNDALDVLEDNAGQIFKSIAKEMIMSTLISQEFIDNYRKMLRDAISTDGAEDDAAVLEGFVDELGGNIAAASEKWEELKRIAEEKGIDMLGVSDESQQTASRKGYETLSEDTGNELVGRALAQYESNLRMEDAMRSTKESVDIMAANQVQIRDIAAESRALIADSYLELQQIRENTGAIIKPITEMNRKMNEWDSKIKGL